MFKRLLFYIVSLILLSTSLVWAGSQQTSSTLASTIITNARYLIHEPTEARWTDDELLVWVNAGIMDIVARTGCMEVTEDITLVADTLEYSLSTGYITVNAAIFVDDYTLSDLTYDSTSNPDTITTAAGDFVTANFEAGDSFTVSGSTSNNGTLTIVSLTATVITLADGALTTDEGSANASGTFMLNVTSRTEGEDPRPYTGLIRTVPQQIGHIQDVDMPTHWYLWNDKVGILPTPGPEENNKKVTVYLIEKPDAVTSSDNIPIPAYFDHVLPLYVAMRAFQADKKTAKAGDARNEYLQAVAQYRGDIIEQKKESEEIIK